ncbi:MAG: hypothetical protein U0R19_21765 [Bryobacteraceae bacterium]
MRGLVLQLAIAALAVRAMSARVVLDDFTTATGGTGNTVRNNNPADGCSGPATANHTERFGYLHAGGFGGIHGSCSRDHHN